MIKGKLEVTLTTDEINYYNSLEVRDKAMPAKVDKLETGNIYYCPVCRKMLFSTNDFCGYCGQRIDKENTEL